MDRLLDKGPSDVFLIHPGDRFSESRRNGIIHCQSIDIPKSSDGDRSFDAVIQIESDTVIDKTIVFVAVGNPAGCAGSFNSEGHSGE